MDSLGQRKSLKHQAEVAGMTTGSTVKKKARAGEKDDDRLQFWSIKSLSETEAELVQAGICHEPRSLKISTSQLCKEWQFAKVKLPVEMIGHACPLDSTAWKLEVLAAKVHATAPTSIILPPHIDPT